MTPIRGVRSPAFEWRDLAFFSPLGIFNEARGFLLSGYLLFYLDSWARYSTVF